MDDDGLIRLKEIIDIDFRLIGKSVVTDSGQRLGKVSSFAVDTLTWLIMKIYAQPPLLRNVGAAELIFARTQIIKVSDTQVVVKGGQQTEDKTLSIKKLIAQSPNPATYSESINSSEA
jgi:sporulation protein YlmC with PRC-barrel domain